MAESFIRRQLAILQRELNPEGAPSNTLSGQVFFLGTALFLVVARYYGRLANPGTLPHQLDGLEWLSHAIGLGGRDLEPVIWWAITALLFRVIGPLVLGTTLGGVSPQALGVARPTGHGVTKEAIAFIGIAIPVYLWLGHTGHLDRLPLYSAAQQGGAAFWAYELLMLIQLLSTAFLFFGFFLMGTSRIIGHHAMILVGLTFALQYGYRPPFEVALVLLAGLGLSHLTLRGRSVLPTLFVISVVALTRDMIALSRHVDGPSALWQALSHLAGS